MWSPSRERLLVILLLSLVLLQSAVAVPSGAFFSYGEDHGDDELPQKDDISSPEIKFSVPLLYYNREYSGAYVNANGMLSFLTELPNFYNVPFPLDYPLIAPLYSDVDLTGTGHVYYRVTSQPALLEQFDDRVSRHFSGGASFHASELLVATWDSVGYYKGRTDKTNTFQLVLGWDGRETFALLLYADGGLRWIAGEGKTAHRADARGQAGLVSGDGRVTELKYSGSDQVRHLNRLSNTGEPGIYMFRVGRIEAEDDAGLPDSNVGSEALRTPPATCAQGGITCHSDATCHDHVDGFCCVCNAGFYGNGQHCLEQDQPLRISGSLHGTVNGFTIEAQELQAYAVVSDGRAYTSLARLIADIGYDMQSAMPAGDLIGWMFAKPADGVLNGFQLTGGVANATIDVDYPQTGDHLVLSQEFVGMGVFNQLGIKTRLFGTVPAVPLGADIEMDNYVNDIVMLGQGQLRISSERMFRQAGNSLSVPMTMTAEVTFAECSGAPRRSELHQLRHVVDRSFIKYEKGEQIVRFASSNKIEGLSDENPCKDAARKCGPNSVCSPDGPEGYRCDCRPGFVYEYREGPEDASPDELRICMDVNECIQQLHNCHQHASCNNEFGSYACLCLPGYIGDGQHCEKLTTCADLNCGENAACYEYSRGQPVCECDIGYAGDGSSCELVPTPGPVPGQCGQVFCHPDASCVQLAPGQLGCACNPGFSGSGLDCLPANHTGHLCQSTGDCGSHAECVFADWAAANVCVCEEGYFGDGERCVLATPLTVLCAGVECHPAADCLDIEGVHQCVCNPGLEGDGYSICKTRPIEKHCDTFADCGPNAECDMADWLGAKICFCRAGFFGDGVNCSVATSLAVLCNGVECHSHAECVEHQAGNLHCGCNPGYVGDGVRCEPDPTYVPCDPYINTYCGENASCSQPPWAATHLCFCDRGFSRDGTVCIPDTDPVRGGGDTCLDDTACAQGERCDHEPETGLFVCSPVPSEAPQPTLPALDGCLEDAECGPDHRCDYSVDTARFVCSPVPTVTPTEPAPTDCSAGGVCSPHAVCGYDVTADTLVCTCTQGFVGDGYMCEAVEQSTTAAAPIETTTDHPMRIQSSCIFGFCVCPEGYTLTDDLEECLLEVVVLQMPVPHCLDDGTTCICPATYRYEPEFHSCQPTGGSDYDTKGPSGAGGGPTPARAEPASTVSPEPEDVDAVTEATVLPDETGPAVEFFCHDDDDCDDGATCAYNATSGQHQCACFPGYLAAEGGRCVPDPNVDCSVLKDCHAEASCVYDLRRGSYQCVCRRGYTGDGKQCAEVSVGCNILDNCGERSDCLYVLEELRFRCRCRPGFSGDGFTCRPSVSCYDEPRQCDVNAACVPDLDGFRCVCLKNYIGDGARCSPAPRHQGGFLLAAQGAAVVNVPFEARRRGRPLVLEPSQTAVGIDADCLEGRFYWTDVIGSKIKSAAYNGSARVQFASGDISSPEGVSVDFISRNVYWTDSSRHVIEVASIATGSRHTLISSELANVRGVAVHPGHGTIFWADWSRQQPRIERAALDGSNRHVLIDSGLGLPNSLAVDFSTDELCWTDAGTKTVECFSLRTRTRRVVAKNASYPFGIAITDDHIYWTDWHDKKIHAVNKANSERAKSLRSVLGSSGKLYGLVATQRSCPQVTNACGSRNGGCGADQLCLPDDRGSRVCVCPDRPGRVPSGPTVCRDV